MHYLVCTHMMQYQPSATSERGNEHIQFPCSSRKSCASDYKLKQACWFVVQFVQESRGEGRIYQATSRAENG